jgi:hypothetical protein
MQYEVAVIGLLVCDAFRRQRRGRAVSMGVVHKSISQSINQLDLLLTEGSDNHNGCVCQDGNA